MGAVTDLHKSLELFGPNGEKWAKGGLNRDDCICIVESLWRVSGTKFVKRDAYKLLQAALPTGYSNLPVFNDAPQTTFEDIKELYARAIDAAWKMK